MDTTTTPTATTHTAGIDPTVAALLASRGPNGIGTGCQGGYVGGWNNGGCNGGGYGYGYGSNGVAEAQALASLTTAKDTITAVTSAKDFLDAKLSHLSTTAQAGFSAVGIAACSNQAATMAAIGHSEYHLGTQAERIGAANALAHCEIKNLIREVACDVKVEVHKEGELTRALINANTLDEVRQQLSDAKGKIAVLDQTNVLLSQLKCCPATASNGNGNSKS